MALGIKGLKNDIDFTEFFLLLPLDTYRFQPLKLPSSDKEGNESRRYDREKGVGIPKYWSIYCTFYP